MMRSQMWALVDTLRVSAAARWTTVQQLRWQTRAVLCESRLRRRSRRVVTPPPIAVLEADTEERLDAEVLCVIARHPDGVRAIDIGNELGIDWRCVRAAAGRLVYRAMVDQVADDFYPVQKASCR